MRASRAPSLQPAADSAALVFFGKLAYSLGVETQTPLPMATLDRIAPVRVMYNALAATSLAHAVRDFEVNPDEISVIYVRNDAWTLAAPAKYEEEARLMWSAEWIGLWRRTPEGLFTWEPIPGREFLFFLTFPSCSSLADKYIEVHAHGMETVTQQNLKAAVKAQIYQEGEWIALRNSEGHPLRKKTLDGILYLDARTCLRGPEPTAPVLGETYIPIDVADMDVEGEEAAV